MLPALTPKASAPSKATTLASFWLTAPMPSSPTTIVPLLLPPTTLLMRSVVPLPAMFNVPFAGSKPMARTAPVVVPSAGVAAPSSPSTTLP